jgi:hypothetical protein
MKNRTRYVYYDKNLGNITHILSKRRRGRAPYIECDIDEVIGFLDGSKGLNRYVVAYNMETKKASLLEKNNIIRLRKPSKELYKIPYKKNVESDLRLIYYSDNVLEVSFDASRVAPLYQTNFKDDVRFERGTYLKLVIKEKDSGNLLREIDIEAQELLDSVQMFFELADHIYPNNVEFFTYKMFEDYSWHMGKMKLMSPLKERIKFEIHKADSKRRSPDFDYHLIIRSTPNGLKIKNNIESPKMIRFYKDIEFFVVDKHDPNILYDKFSLNIGDIEFSQIIVNLKVDAKDKAILYNHKYISVLKED